MRLAAALACTLVFGACAAGTRPSSSSDDAVLSEMLIARENASWAAWKARDGAFFASFLSPDHVEVGAGGPSDKPQVVAFVGSPVCVVESYAVDHFRMTRLNADTAVLVYHASQKTTCGGTAVPSPVWATSVYVNRGGQWLNALYQQSPAAR